MRSNFLKSAAIGLMAGGMALTASSAEAVVLPVTNLTFSIYTGNNPKDNFSLVNPTNWARGPAAGIQDLVCIDSPAQGATFAGPNNCYANYGPFPNPPVPGNFIQADGNPDFESIFQQVIPGLVAGNHYTLSFWQAAGQEIGFSGATTEQWRVVLGGTGITLSPPVPGPCVADPTFSDCYVANLNGGYEDTVNESIMHTPSQGVTLWNLVTLDLIAPSNGNNLLQFLAWGNSGSNANIPPTLFLAGVNTPGNAPEPATLSLFGAGLAGVWLRRRAKRKA